MATATTPGPVAWLWDGLVPMGCLSLIDGPPGVGKSSPVAGLEVSVASGLPFLGANILGGEVIHVDFDTDLRLQHPWCTRAASGMGEAALGRIRYAHPANGLSMLNLTRIAQLREEVISRGAKLVVIDTFSSAFSSGARFCSAASGGRRARDRRVPLAR